MTYCPRDDSMLAAYCSHCRGMDPTPAALRRGVVDVADDVDERWFEATHPGECNACFKRFKPGDQIRWDDGPDKYPGARVCCG